jgi:hypothetical protein
MYRYTLFALRFTPYALRFTPATRPNLKPGASNRFKLRNMDNGNAKPGTTNHKLLEALRLTL